MDVIVIGKKTHQRSDVPVVVYSGQSRDEAMAAVSKTGGEFSQLYYVNPEPYMRINTPAPTAAAAPAAQPEAAPEPPKSGKKAKVLT